MALARYGSACCMRRSSLLLSAPAHQRTGSGFMFNIRSGSGSGSGSGVSAAVWLYSHQIRARHGCKMGRAREMAIRTRPGGALSSLPGRPPAPRALASPAVQSVVNEVGSCLEPGSQPERHSGCVSGWGFRCTQNSGSNVRKDHRHTVQGEQQLRCCSQRVCGGRARHGTGQALGQTYVRVVCKCASSGFAAVVVSTSSVGDSCAALRALSGRVGDV